MSAEQKPDRAEISRTQNEPQKILARSLALAAEAKGIELSQARLEIYLADLSGLNIDATVRAIDELRREQKFFPDISEIRERVLGSLEKLTEAEAENAWIVAQRYAADHYHPDLGFHGVGRDPTPPVSRAIDYAVRACGGWDVFWHRMYQDDGISFLRREFVGAYERVPEVVKLAGGLSDKELLESLSAEVEGFKKLSD